ncbi:MAG: undecaprenyldiphospho-muramoylpentapeptide beta-N-acetylglucosaminyltransferase [Oscillospiraceae bacterium]|nr:undecaprenyldiphospho-muramoylpentapeptide beta-N-acetylglucosaminyltransferase [Oscillospiraceae bacterium]
MNFLFACGGTAGHINPAIGVAGRIRELLPDSRFLFIGANGMMETELVPREGYEIRTIPISSLSRSLSAEGVRHNLRAARELAASIPAARKIIRDFRPDAVIGTGGYVCFPVLTAAAKMGIPTAVHESNAEPGLTTRMLERRVTTIMVGFEDARKNYRQPEKVRVTGTPVRLGFMNARRETVRRSMGLSDDTPLVVSVWGSLGATDMNRTVADMIALAMPDRPFRMIHSAGKRGIAGMTSYMTDTLGLKGWEEEGFSVRDYLYDMPSLMAAADLVLCRSGASTLAELAAMGRPALLVPSPNVVNNHQEKNARVLERAGAARVLLESEASAQTLLQNIRELLSEPERLAAMAKNMKAMAVENATDEITSLVLGLAVK